MFLQKILEYPFTFLIWDPSAFIRKLNAFISEVAQKETMLENHKRGGNSKDRERWKIVLVCDTFSARVAFV